MMKRSIWTRTHDSVDDKGEKVSEIHTSNSHLILYFNNLKNWKKSRVIDIDFKNQRMWIYKNKNDKWIIFSQKVDNKKGIITDILKTEKQWSEDIAEKI